MRKMKLEIGTLQVESFPTLQAPPERGTVDGAEGTLRTNQCGSCAGFTCDGATCVTSCGGQPQCTCPPPL